jgi:hypothetical protein
MKMQMFMTLEKVKSDTVNRGLNLTAVKFTTIQMTRQQSNMNYMS